MGPAILGGIVLLFILLAYMGAKAWYVWHVVLVVCVFIAAGGALVLTAATMKTQQRWRTMYNDQTRLLEEKQELALVRALYYFNLGLYPLVREVLDENEELSQGKGLNKALEAIGQASFERIDEFSCKRRLKSGAPGGDRRAVRKRSALTSARGLSWSNGGVCPPHQPRWKRGKGCIRTWRCGRKCAAGSSAASSASGRHAESTGFIGTR